MFFTLSIASNSGSTLFAPTCLPRSVFLAYQKRFSVIFTSADKPYLTYPYPTRGIAKQVAQRATIAHLSPMCQGQISFQKIQTHPSFNACSCYMKVSKGSNQKKQRKSGNTIFPIIRSIGVFLRSSRAANSVVGGPIWPKFKLIHNIMHVLVTSKFEKDRININRDYVMTSIF